MDPDELFTKYSVAEVRNVQMRLRCVYSGQPSDSRIVKNMTVVYRADADAKKEELRIMVGCVHISQPLRPSQTYNSKA